MRWCSFVLIPLLIFTSCTKFTDVPAPPGRQLYGEAFANDVLATGKVLGMYENALKDHGLLNGHLTRFCGLYADELTRQGGGAEKEFLEVSLNSNNRFLPALWTPGYTCIVSCNTAIAQLGQTQGVSSPLKEYLMGEAHFLRALCYFFLLQVFDHIPLVTGTDVNANAQAPQAAPEAVYDHIIADLQEATRLLPVVHPQAPADTLRHTRAERSAAEALLARVHLYRGNYTEAAYYASLVIDSGRYKLAENLDSAFVYTSDETIFQLKPVHASYLTAEGSVFVPKNGASPVYELTATALQAFSPGDRRRHHWVKAGPGGGKDYPYKYKINGNQARTEYCIVLRLGEQYLIRAEARARQGHAAAALDDLSVLRNRSGIPGPGTITDIPLLLAAIAGERQAELGCEWGHRFFDLKRWSRAGDLLQPYADSCLRKKVSWAPYKLSFPLPKQELQKNPLLVQNYGY